MTDIIAALRSFLLLNGAVAPLVDNRIYAGELPKDETPHMPLKAIVLRYAGGIESNTFVPITRPRIDITSYGETYHEAGTVDRAVYDALKALDRQTVDGVLLHGVALSGGPIMLKDPQTNWPYQWRSITVTADERNTVEE